MNCGHCDEPIKKAEPAGECPTHGTPGATLPRGQVRCTLCANCYRNATGDVPPEPVTDTRKAPNWVNDLLDRATKTVEAWPNWMRRGEFLGRIVEPTYPRHPLPWKVRESRMHRPTAFAVLDAESRFVAECETREIAEFICFASVHAPARAMKLIGEPVEEKEKSAMRTTISISVGHRRRHVAVKHCASSAYGHGWVLQVANPTEYGYRFDPPHAGPFKSKAAALRAKKGTP